LKRGRIERFFSPRLMVYALMEDSALEMTSFNAKTTFIRITMSSFFSFPFPHCDIIVSLCRYLYHPFYASILFVNGNRCMVVGCKSMLHFEWHCSFGWRERGFDLVKKVLMLGLAKKRKKTL